MKQPDDLVRIGKLKTEPPTNADFEGLVRSGQARLKDAEMPQAHNKRTITEYSGETEIEAELMTALMRVARDLERRVSRLTSPTSSANRYD